MKEDGKRFTKGRTRRCCVSGLEKNTEYRLRVKCVVGDLQGMWSDVATFKTKSIQVRIDSTILSKEANCEVFEEKLYEQCGTNNFELLYRGSRDGFRAIDFHRQCDNKGQTLVLIKNTSGHVFGGFASVPWTSPDSFTYRKASGSFLFTLTNMHGIQPTRFPLKNENDEEAVQYDKEYGPIFGGYDFVIYPPFNTNTCTRSDFPSTYNDATGKRNSIFSSNTNSGNFQVQEIEVFKVNN